jgi:SAM-dependent MidA family methyltransferase
VSPFLAEVRPAVSSWVEQVSQCLENGLLLVCDYGYPVEGFFHAARQEGTLWCYHQHHRDDDPLDRPGLKDISAHVDFTALELGARAAGWEPVGFTDQHHFLVGASEDWLRSIDGLPPSPEQQKRLRHFQRLMHPESMGTRFHFWGGGKGLPSGWTPSGFHHGRRSVG